MKRKERDMKQKSLLFLIFGLFVLFVLLYPMTPIETQIQCFTTPCNPIVENKSIVDIIIMKGNG